MKEFLALACAISLLSACGGPGTDSSSSASSVSDNLSSSSSSSSLESDPNCLFDCDDVVYNHRKTETSRYILHNHSNYEVEITFSLRGISDYESMIVPAGEELVFFEETLLMASTESGITFPSEVFDGKLEVTAYYDGTEVLVYTNVDDFSVFQQGDSFRLNGGVTVYPFNISVTDTDIGASAVY